MKKILNILISFVIVFTLTGCDKKEYKERTSIEILSDVIKKTENNKEGKIDFNFQLKMNYGGMTVDGDFSLGIAAIEENGKIRATIELGENPFIGENTFYLDDITFYIPSSIIDLMYNIEPENKDWIKFSLGENDDESNINGIKNKNIEVKEILTTKDFYLINRSENIGLYRLVISKDLIEKIDKYLNSDTTIDFDNIANDATMNIDITINEKNNQITKVSLNFIDAIKLIDLDSIKDEETRNEIESTINQIENAIERLALDINISYDSITIDIPEEITTNALTIEQYIIKIQDLIINE